MRSWRTGCPISSEYRLPPRPGVVHGSTEPPVPALDSTLFRTPPGITTRRGPLILDVAVTICACMTYTTILIRKADLEIFLSKGDWKLKGCTFRLSPCDPQPSRDPHKTTPRGFWSSFPNRPTPCRKDSVIGWPYPPPSSSSMPKIMTEKPTQTSGCRSFLITEPTALGLNGSMARIVLPLSSRLRLSFFQEWS